MTVVVPSEQPSTSSDDVSSFSIGLMLAFGGGVYIHIGATECMPRVYSLPVASDDTGPLVGGL
jgi:hypothetical protein